MEKLTERLRLREFTEQDVDAIAEFREDPRYLEFYYRPAYSREECECFVDMCIAWSQERPRCKFQLAITDRSSGALLGDCGVRTDNPGSRRGDIGYELSPAHWGNGFATEAVRAMLDFGFSDLDLDEIEARCVAANDGPCVFSAGWASRRRNVCPKAREEANSRTAYYASGMYSSRIGTNGFTACPVLTLDVVPCCEDHGETWDVAAFSRFDLQLGGKSVGIHRITSMVPITQLDQAIAFYSQGLGLQVVRRRDEWGHALLEGEHGCQMMIDRSIRKESNASTVVYYYTCDIETVRDRLIAAGFDPDPIGVTFYDMTEFRVRDPDGNEVWVGEREAPG